MVVLSYFFKLEIPENVRAQALNCCGNPCKYYNNKRLLEKSNYLECFRKKIRFINTLFCYSVTQALASKSFYKTASFCSRNHTNSFENILFTLSNEKIDFPAGFSAYRKTKNCNIYVCRT